MRSFFKEWPRLHARLRHSRRRLLLFDFDGTLAPLAGTPSQARLASGARHALRELSRRPGNVVGVVSGRALSNVRRKVNVNGLTYVGNHGLEIQTPGGTRVHPGARTLARGLRLLARQLRAKLGSIPGAWVEDKGLSLSVHFRKARPGNVRVLARGVEQILQRSPLARLVDSRRGNKVIDIFPRLRWDKGAAVRWLIARMPGQALAFYAGDDTTDESVFRVLRSRAITLRVGPRRRSRAGFYISRQTQMPHVLKRLLWPHEGKGGSHGTTNG